jgi:hypothetical protein
MLSGTLGPVLDRLLFFEGELPVEFDDEDWKTRSGDELW